MARTSDLVSSAAPAEAAVLAVYAWMMCGVFYKTALKRLCMLPLRIKEVVYKRGENNPVITAVPWLLGPFLAFS